MHPLVLINSESIIQMFVWILILLAFYLNYILFLWHLKLLTLFLFLFLLFCLRILRTALTLFITIRFLNIPIRFFIILLYSQSSSSSFFHFISISKFEINKIFIIWIKVLFGLPRTRSEAFPCHSKLKLIRLHVKLDIFYLVILVLD